MRQGIKSKGQNTISINCNKHIDEQRSKFQFSHWTPSDESLVRSMWNGDCIMNGISSNSRGVAILLHHNFG